MSKPIKHFIYYLLFFSIFISCACTQLYGAEISASNATIQIEIKPYTLELSKKFATITKIINQRNHKTLSKGSGGLYLIDGVTRKELFAKKAILTSASKDAINYNVDFGEPGVSVNYHLRLMPEGLLWTVAISNETDQIRMYEVRLGLPLDFSKHTYNYWDGYDHHSETPNAPVFQKCSARTNLYAINALPTIDTGGKHPRYPFSKNLIWGNVCIFPMNCLWNQNGGFALGVSPFQPGSYYSGGVQPARSPAESFYYALKLVVMPHKTASRTFVLYPFRGHEGYRAAIKTYYNLFPRAFARRTTISPKVYLPATGGYFLTLANLSRHNLGGLWEEFCRRYYIGWMWLFAPFQETGEWFPSATTYRPDAWYQMLGTGRNKIRADSDIYRFLQTYKGWVDYLRKIIAYAQRSAIIGWYIIPERCSTHLADKSFKNAIIHRWGTNVPYFMKSGPSGHPQYSLFALDNSFAAKNKADIKKILTIAGAGGLAFDNALAFEQYYGKDVLKSPGKAAFRDGKPYIVNNLAYQDLEHYIRNLNLENAQGFHPAVFTNGPWNIATAEFTDAALIEYHPYAPAKMISSFAMLRYLLGPQKPISYKVQGRSDLGRRGARKPLNEIYNERLYSLLTLFRWGAFPRISEALGDADIIAALPTLLHLFRAGWEPVPGLDFNQDHLWLERFGKGTNTYLSIINHRQTACADVLKGNAELGKGLFFFESVFGDPLASQAENGRTLIKLDIRPVWLSVAKAYLNLVPATAVGRASASITHKYWHGRKIAEISLTVSRETAAELYFPKEAGATGIRVLINGTPVKPVSEGQSFKCRGYLKRKNLLKVSYLEQIPVNPNPEAVLACNFFPGTGPRGAILTPNTSLKVSALRIRNYFLYYALAEDFERYYQSHGRTPAPDIKRVKGLPEIVSDEPAGRPLISLSVNPKLPNKGEITVVRRHAPYRLNLEGRNAKDLGQVVLKFLRLLDKKYPRYGYDMVFKKSWLKPGLLAHDIPGCHRMGWAEFLKYKNSLVQ